MCDKINSIKIMSDKLRVMKYNEPIANKGDINNLIETIQADCLLVAMDKGEYWKSTKESLTDLSVMSPEEEKEWKIREQQQDRRHNQTAFKGKI